MSRPDRVIDSQLIYDGKIVRFRVDTVVLPDGATARREIIGTPGPSSPDADEYLEVVTLPLDRALAMVRSGQISDAKTIAGLLLTAVDP